MENIYDDYAIILPEEMENIAKRYQEQIGKKNKLSQIACTKKVCLILEEIINAYHTLKCVKSKKMFNKHKDFLTENLDTLLKLYAKFSNHKINITKIYGMSFCCVVKFIINKLTEFIEFIYNQSLLPEKNECVLIALSLIKNTIMLMPDCKYKIF